MMRPPVSAADLLRAFDAIRPKTDQEKRTVARMLGFDWEAQPATPLTDIQRNIAKEDDPQRAPIPPSPVASPLPFTPGDSTVTVGFRLSGPKPAARPQLDWLRSGPVMPDQPMGQSRRPAPLFHPQWTRAILGASLSAQTFTGPPDMDRAVDMIARGEAMKILPRQPVMTLTRGVQALLDIGESMQPFAQDHAALRRDLMRIVGDGSLELLQFSGSPRKTRRDGSRRPWRDYESNFLPQSGACVLVVSDFGIGRLPGLRSSASPSTWLALAGNLKRRGHRVVGFVPYSPSRWPSLLDRAVDLVPWDRSTTVGLVRFSRRPGLVR
jgi:hypothetical protein